MKYPRGSEWRRWDLHFHTPSSYDYRDKSIKDEEIIQVLKKNNISVVAITDHQVIDVVRITNLKKIAKDDITIIPGIELCSDSRGVDPVHFIGLFPEDGDLEYIYAELKSGSGIARQQAEGKNPEEIYCNLKQTSELIVKLGGIVSIHAGRKSNSIEEISNSLPVTMAEKEDIVKNIQLFELGQERDQLDYVDKVFPKIGNFPMVMGSDNHNIKKYILKQNLWIKSNPTFEGLRQIIYEPKDRVRIQELIPQEKSDYHIIDRVEYKNGDELKIIKFNQNLNSIIGSRANGKSTLLRNIAFSVDPVQFKKKEINYNFFQLDDFKLFWRDGSSNTLKETEKKEKGILFTPQNYLGKLVDDHEAKFDSFLSDLFNNEETFRVSKELYKQFEDQNVLQVTTIIRELLSILEKINENSIESIKLGREKDLVLEMAEIEKIIKDTNKDETSISQRDLEIYRSLNTSLNTKILELKSMNNDLSSFELLKTEKIITADVLSNFSFSEKYKAEILEKIMDSDRSFKVDFIDNEIVKLKELIKNTGDVIKEINEKIRPLKEKIEKHKALADLTESLEDKRKILVRIKLLTGQLDKLRGSYTQKIDELISKYELFREKFNMIAISVGNLDFSNFSIITDFNEEDFINYLDKHINYHNSVKFREKGEYLNANYLLNDPPAWRYDKKKLSNTLKDLLKGILSDKLMLKTGEHREDVLIGLFRNRFKINFSKSITSKSRIEFNDMSDGEKMIALLEFIFKFDKYNYPVLLDQPEDDLDVKAISNYIVNFISKQKDIRQIIIVSHNSNLVVCGDSEEILVAKKTNMRNPNFVYETGAIEEKNIRKEIVEILEGGGEALRKRKNKLNIND